MGASVCGLGADRIARGVADGEWSAVEVVTEALAAIRATEPAVRALLDVEADEALEAAARVDAERAAGRPLGPLAGVPVVLKDNISLRGTPTTCGSRMLEGYVVPYDATCARRLLDAGAVCVGKANMDEFAFGSDTQSSALASTRNPWDAGRVPGGSSGGSAASVAAGQVPLALGTDTGGSVRQPAALCGTFAMKPSYGTVSRYGVVAFASSLDQVGPISRDVRGAVLALDAMAAAGPDPLDATSVGLRRPLLPQLGLGVRALRLGVLVGLPGELAPDQEVARAVGRAADALRDAGMELVEVRMGALSLAAPAYYALSSAQAFSNLARFDGVRYGLRVPGPGGVAEQVARSRGAGFGPEAVARQLLGYHLLDPAASGDLLARARRARTLVVRDLARALSACDVLLSPVVPAPAPRVGERVPAASDALCCVANLAGSCAATVPMGLGPGSGLPVAVQLQAAPGADGLLARACAALEAQVGTMPVAHLSHVGESAVQVPAPEPAAPAAGPADRTMGGEVR